jgi:hypothetical protein
MITPQEWQKRALELDREGLEVNVVGRAGKLSTVRASGSDTSAVKADNSVAVTITLGKVLIAAGAAGLLRDLLEHVLIDAVGHARASNRNELTAEDIEEAWKRHRTA